MYYQYNTIKSDTRMFPHNIISTLIYPPVYDSNSEVDSVDGCSDSMDTSEDDGKKVISLSLLTC